MSAHSKDDRYTSDRSKSNREVGKVAGRGPKGTKRPVRPVTTVRIFGGEWPAPGGQIVARKLGLLASLRESVVDSCSDVEDFG